MTTQIAPALRDSCEPPVMRQRYLLLPAICASAGEATAVQIVELAAAGLRLEHGGERLEVGSPLTVRFSLPQAARELCVEGHVIWSRQAGRASNGELRFTTGLHADEQAVLLLRSLIAQLCANRRALLFDEERRTDRYEFVALPPVRIDQANASSLKAALYDLSVYGARLITREPLTPGEELRVAASFETRERSATVMWSASAEDADHDYPYQAGVAFHGPCPELDRLLRQFCGTGTVRLLGARIERLQSLRLRILERLRRSAMESASPAPALALVPQIFDHLRRSPEEAARWYDKAVHESDEDLPPDLEHRDAIAVWEMLDRRVPLDDLCGMDVFYPLPEGEGRSTQK